MSRFEARRELFWDGPRNFELQLDDEDDTRAGTPSSNLRTTVVGGRLTHDVRFNINQATYMADLQWNRVSNLAPSGTEASPLNHQSTEKASNMLFGIGSPLSSCAQLVYHVLFFNKIVSFS
ncbi:hypothetical protein AVEN_16692-1 [Araneus ventricosus]|uniref:Uncharacterized protein n=1 Tax=Araneus ventricosus TaxID=182803 RepID=A0A4Y2Q802_ARAVE|nr:hypothetical protein AVEN_140620-1 [Araneus ventricosus]GBN59020.1 hypothetical protein AVEN_16692-1 [Araneus ventricosus]